MKFWKKVNNETNRLEEACKRLPEGSAEAYSFLFTKYREGIYRFCLKMLADNDVAEDAFQEVFIKVYENRTKFTGTNFQGWVYTIARNVCINIINARKQNSVFDETYQSPIVKNKFEYDFELKTVISEAIEKLPLILKEVFIMKEYEQLKYNDIAEILGIDLNLAKVRGHRARLKLREYLESYIKEEKNV